MSMNMEINIFLLYFVFQSITSLKNWNLDLHDELVKMKGRILTSQKVYCNNKQYDTGSEANWTKHVRSLPMFTSAIIRKWVVLYPQQNDYEVKAFIKTIHQVAKSMAFNIPQPEQ